MMKRGFEILPSSLNNIFSGSWQIWESASLVQGKEWGCKSVLRLQYRRGKMNINIYIPISFSFINSGSPPTLWCVLIVCDGPELRISRSQASHVPVHSSQSGCHLKESYLHQTVRQLGGSITAKRNALNYVGVQSALQQPIDISGHRSVGSSCF